MSKSITIVVPDDLATELLAYTTPAYVKSLFRKVLADLLREARTAVAEAAKPPIVPVDDSGVDVSIS